MSLAEIPKPKLFKPVEDFSSLIEPGHADIIRDSLKHNGSLLYKNEILLISKERGHINGEPSINYSVFDSKNAMPQYGLQCLANNGKEVFAACTWEYNLTYYQKDGEPLDKNDIILTSTYTYVIPKLNYQSVYKSIVDMNDKDLLYKGTGKKPYLTEQTYLPKDPMKGIELAETITQQIRRIPGEQNIVFKTPR